ncbi:hypothetical protein C8R45DRAFT_928658 [Mycena sanguinolenta]|nr:hypothetical protein C8R45DRAFT_928658 [Mycena sanguinolenta]
MYLLQRRARFSPSLEREHNLISMRQLSRSILGLVPELLKSPDIHIRRLTYWILGILVYQDSTGKAISTYNRLASSLRVLYMSGGGQVAYKTSQMALVIARHVENHKNDSKSLFQISFLTQCVNYRHPGSRPRGSSLRQAPPNIARETRSIGRETRRGHFSKRKIIRGWLSTALERIEIWREDESSVPLELRNTMCQ